MPASSNKQWPLLAAALHLSTDKTDPMIRKNENLNKLHFTSLLYPSVGYLGAKFTKKHLFELQVYVCERHLAVRKKAHVFNNAEDSYCDRPSVTITAGIIVCN